MLFCANGNTKMILCVIQSICSIFCFFAGFKAYSSFQYRKKGVIDEKVELDESPKENLSIDFEALNSHSHSQNDNSNAKMSDSNIIEQNYIVNYQNPENEIVNENFNINETKLNNEFKKNNKVKIKIDLFEKELKEKIEMLDIPRNLKIEIIEINHIGELNNILFFNNYKTKNKLLKNYEWNILANIHIVKFKNFTLKQIEKLKDINIAFKYLFISLLKVQIDIFTKILILQKKKITEFDNVAIFENDQIYEFEDLAFKQLDMFSNIMITSATNFNDIAILQLKNFKKLITIQFDLEYKMSTKDQITKLRSESIKKFKKIVLKQLKSMKYATPNIMNLYKLTFANQMENFIIELIN